MQPSLVKVKKKKQTNLYSIKDISHPPIFHEAYKNLEQFGACEICMTSVFCMVASMAPLCGYSLDRAFIWSILVSQCSTSEAAAKRYLTVLPAHGAAEHSLRLLNRLTRTCLSLGPLQHLLKPWLFSPCLSWPFPTSTSLCGFPVPRSQQTKILPSNSSREIDSYYSFKDLLPYVFVFKCN